MKTTEMMQDRARARQERINESKALLHEARRRQQERQKKDAQPEAPVEQAAPIKEGGSIERAPVIARNLREQMLAQNPPVFPSHAEDAPAALVDDKVLRTRMLSELRLATIRQIEKGEWDAYFESLIHALARAAEMEKSSKLKQESE